MENRRQYTRYAVALAAEVEAHGETIEAETRDVSEGGVAVLLTEQVEEGSKVGLTLILTQDGIEDPDEDPFQCDASVMWAAPQDDGRALVGLRYVAARPEELARLRRFLAAVAEAAR
jgi:c-di-GMP-binding flagellar brake protein YcgR